MDSAEFSYDGYEPEFPMDDFSQDGFDEVTNALLVPELEGRSVAVNDHARKALAYFNRMYKSEQRIDLLLTSGGVVIAKVHRLIAASFCRMLDPIIASNSKSPLIKLDIPYSTGITTDDLRAVFDFLYTGRICINGPGVLLALEELGCTQILPLLMEIWQDGHTSPIVEDRHHAVNFLNRLKEFRDAGKYIDCTLRLENDAGVECHRWVLAAFSNLVENSLCDSEQSAFVSLEITELGCVSRDAVQQLIDYIYSGLMPYDVIYPSRLRQAALIFGVYCLAEKLPHVEEPMRPVEMASFSQPGPSFAPERFASPPARPQPPQKRRIYIPKVTGADIAANTDYATIYNQYVDGPKEATYREVAETDSENGGVASEDMKRARFRCPYCDYAAQDRTTVRKHLRCIHTQETPYQCHVCHMDFKIQSNLARHLRSHSQVKPYRCKSCGIEYADKKNADAHVFREHLHRKPFRCPYCANAKFYREDSWQRHCARFHPNEKIVPFELQMIN